ncbi:MAG: TIGR02996 domain-containing protein, partial [Myxococcota bacterium]|nr:TIGR02996 domain-containing protein [Myxococcota bacterium]
MDRVVAARKLLAELVKGEQLEVRRLEIVGRDLAQLVETLGRPPSAHELEDWLGQHPQVTEIYAAASLLEELVDRHLTPPASELAIGADARHPELERQLREAPDHAPAYHVYADWLQEQGDPLGELIALGIAALPGADEDRVRFERHLKRHEARFLGGLAPRLAERIALRWRHGLVHAIEELAEPLPPSQWRELLLLRVCEVVQAITLRRPCSPELAAIITEEAAPSLRSLTLEGCSGRPPAVLMQRELRTLVLAGPRVVLGAATLPGSLERIELRVQVVEDAIEHGPLELGVRELHVLLTPQVAPILAAARLPRLERLTLAGDPGAGAGQLPDL